MRLRLVESLEGNTFIFDGKKAWSGAVNLTDGVIEETHTYEEAENSDFHHSFYFSEPQLDSMDEGESCFFCIFDDGEISIDTTNRLYDDDSEVDEEYLKDRIKEQVKFI